MEKKHVPNHQPGKGREHPGNSWLQGCHGADVVGDTPTIPLELGEPH